MIRNTHLVHEFGSSLSEVECFIPRDPIERRDFLHDYRNISDRDDARTAKALFFASRLTFSDLRVLQSLDGHRVPFDRLEHAIVRIHLLNDGNPSAQIP